MKCYICGNEGATRKNMVLNHCRICESYVCVCADCFKQIKYCRCGNPSGKTENRYIGKIKFL